MAWFAEWINNTPLFLVAAMLLGPMAVVAMCGAVLRSHTERLFRQDAGGGQEGYIVSAVLGLVALLLGFTFALAVDRYETRRALVLEEANAIGTTYLRVQLLPEPHRARLSQLLVQYTDNRIVLSEAPRQDVEALLAVNNRLLTDIWAATAAAFDDVQGLVFSGSLLESVNALIDLDAARKSARAVRVPSRAFAVLFLYLIVTAAVLGYVLTGFRGRVSAGLMLTLLTLALMLILDVDRPTSGKVRESQEPMLSLQRSLRAQPPEIFDRWRRQDREDERPAAAR